jgi:DnaK suppressor protein
MEEKTKKELEKKLKRKQRKLEEELKRFAKKEKNWEVKFPKFNGGESGGGILEKGADEIEEYNYLLSLAKSLKKSLAEVERALNKIKKGNFGICEKCKKEIELKRLKVQPEARFCLKCQKNNG